MAEILVRPPTEYLREESPEAGQLFRELRNALLAAGPLDRATCELIVISGLATAGFEDSFKIHARRLIDMETPMAAMKHAVMMSLGASASIFQLARALEWLNDLEKERKETATPEPHS